MSRVRIAARLALTALALLSAGCTTRASLSYAPPPPMPGLFAPVPVIATIAVLDQRKEAPHRLATLMNVYGMPTKILDTRLPVKDEIGTVFDQALLARHLTMNDGNGKLAVALLVRKFDSDMILGGQANIDLTMTLIDRRSNQAVYTDRVVEQVRDSSHAAGNFIVGPMIGTGIDVLQRMCEQVLNAAINELLEKPGFKQAVVQASGTGVTAPAN